MRNRLIAALILAASAASPQVQFQNSDRCMACHNGLQDRVGEDISIGFDWRPTMMANSSRDPYWQAGVRREITDHASARAAIEGECSICHMPMVRYETKLAGREGRIFAHLPFNPQKPDDQLAADGVSCSLCHRIENEKLGTRESFVGGFVVSAENGRRRAYGPFQVDEGRAAVMRSATGLTPTEGKHIRESEVCATCHTLYTHALGPQGQVIGELPEQVPYQEWRHSSYRGSRSCQACHMPTVSGEAPISAVLGQPRNDVSRHVFVGGNFFIPAALNRFRNELGVAALSQELDSAIARTRAHLASDAARLAIERLEVGGGRLEAAILVENLGGHKLPTAYPSRRVWLRVAVLDRNNRKVFESGGLTPDGAIAGNDNDADANRFEPHYLEITEPGQVQIYEDIMGDSSGAPTTGLLRAVRYLKDNRLLPHGFDKLTADKDIAVIGEAAEDADFGGGSDRIRYSVPLNGAEGPYQLEAELWYQPISFRWASNLRAYDAPEPKRFVGYFDAMVEGSAAALARATMATR